MITRVEIENIQAVGGVSVIEPGRICILSGRNDTGKTTRLEAIRAVLRGGNDQTLLARGATKGSVSLTIDDGTVFTRTWRRLPSGNVESEVEVVHKDFGPLKRPQQLINGLIDDLAIDPMAIVHAPQKTRASMIADLLRVEVSREELVGLTGEKWFQEDWLKAEGFDRIALARTAVFDARTGRNKTASDAKSTVRELTKTLPPEGSHVDPTPLREQLGALERETTKRKRRIVSEREAKVGNALADEREATRQADKVLAAERERLRVLHAEELLELQVRQQKERSAIETTNEHACKHALAERLEATNRAEEEERQETAAVEADVASKRAELTAAIAKAEASHEEHVRGLELRKIIDSTKAKAEVAAAESKALTSIIEALDQLRLDKMAKTPIPGLEIRGGEVFFNDTTFDRLNRATKYKLAFKLAAHRAGRLGLIVMDDTEALVGSTREEFLEAAAESGLQVIMAEAVDTDFRVLNALPEEGFP